MGGWVGGLQVLPLPHPHPHPTPHPNFPWMGVTHPEFSGHMVIVTLHSALVSLRPQISSC